MLGVTPHPVVALLTDFGTRDHYVGAVKGAILSVCPEAVIVDVTHEIAPHDVAEGAFALAAAYRAFPRGTTFVAVVDPGVGTARRGLAFEAGGHRFIGPDNGLFTLVLADHPGVVAREITNASFFHSEVSATFHARDVFGPVAAHLAGGMPLDRLGPAIEAPVALPVPAIREAGASVWEAEVIHVDRFGNLTTNLTRADLDRILGSVKGGRGGLVVDVLESKLPIVRTYGDVPEGEACALLGSSDRLEIAIHRGSAALRLGAGRGARVRLRKA
jgi:S-adenosyl-L-methionine hydrolase (adenosine-forming)